MDELFHIWSRKKNRARSKQTQANNQMTQRLRLAADALLSVGALGKTLVIPWNHTARNGGTNVCSIEPPYFWRCKKTDSSKLSIPEDLAKINLTSSNQFVWMHGKMFPCSKIQCMHDTCCPTHFLKGGWADQLE